MAGTRKVYVQDIAPDGLDVNSGLTDAEVVRSITNLYGAPWVATATVCRNADGSLQINRPPAAPKAAR